MRASEIGAGIESSGRYLGYLAVATNSREWLPD